MKTQKQKSGTLFIAILFIMGPEFSKEEISLTENTKGLAVEDKRVKEFLSPPTEQNVIETVEGKLDKSPVRAADIEAMRRQAEAKKGQEQGAMPQSKYTAPGTPPDVAAEDHLQNRLAAEQRDPFPQAEVKFPPQIDSIVTPQQTETISTPTAPEAAPNPFETPPIKVDPTRVPKE